ncbi:uncharacterized protein LOC134664177 [Cydia fagiglandana]|uniref:uncharacterized protein LOC134664177 n=1 Tax=Cydia fagiglandana TaxID=1458189 RepID=UPI00212F4A2A
MDEMKKILQSIQDQQQKQSDEIKCLGDTVAQKVIEKLDHRLVAIEQKQLDLENKLVLQENHIENLERRLRQRNIILFGLTENERSYFDLEKNVLQFINNTMRVQCYEIDIEAVRRIGKKGNKTRPVIITFTTLSRKIQVLWKKKNLEGTNWHIKEDFTEKVLEKRKGLQEEAKQEREKGNKVIIRQDKLIILKNKDNPSQRSEKHYNNTEHNLKKRNINSVYSPPRPPSQSSDKENEINVPDTLSVNPQAPKKNKYTITDYMTSPIGSAPANAASTTSAQRPPPVQMPLTPAQKLPTPVYNNNSERKNL